MCGIFGVHGRPGIASDQALEQSVAAMYHRGPDGRRTWTNANRTVGLGHSRLSIIDLEGGAQPLFSEDGSITAVVNGEFYGFEQLRSELEGRGHRFATKSDSEILIHLYEDLGVDCVDRLRGEFAFILWDAAQGRLFACRDRFGIKPLYYSLRDNNLYLGSEIKALLAAGVPAQWDHESVHAAIQMGAVTLQNRTLFRNIFQVPPGHYATMKGGRFTTKKYWDFNYPTVEQNASTSHRDEQVLEEFRELFEDAVRLRLRADVPVGVYLSGGIDSSSILGTAARLRADRLRAFTLSFLDSGYDESAIAREMADHAGADFTAFQVTPQVLVDHFVQAVGHSETLMSNMNSISKFYLSKKVQESGCKVVLTGEGADEILGGYVHFRQDLLMHDSSSTFDGPRENADVQTRLTDVTSDGMALVRKYHQQDNVFTRRLQFVPSWLCPMIEGAQKGRFLLNKRFLSAHAAFDPYASLLDGLDVKGQMEGRHVLHQSQYLWSKLFLPNYMLTNLGDRMEMGHGIEGRVPFLDHKVVEFVTRLPASFKIRKMQEKYLLREALKPVLTKTVYDRQKHPFIAPPTAGTRKDPVFRFLSEYILDHARNLPFVNPNQLGLFLRTLPYLPAPVRRKADIMIVIFASMVALQENFSMEA